MGDTWASCAVRFLPLPCLLSSLSVWKSERSWKAGRALGRKGPHGGRGSRSLLAS